MRAVASALSLLLSTPFVALLAQVQPTVEPGSRVRLTAPDRGVEKSVGACVSLSDGSMRFVPESGAGPWTIPLASVTALEVSRGRKSRWLTAAGIGVFGGAVFDAATGTSMEADFSDRDKRIIAAAGLGLAGGLVGGLVGSAIKIDRWEEVPLDQFRVSIAPQHKRRLRLGLSLVF